MTAIGPGNLGAINLAGSVAGAQRNSADANEVKHTSVQRQSQADLKELAAKSVNDIGAADESADRDADGRLLHGDADDAVPSEEEATVIEAVVATNGNIRPTDAHGQLGQHLDLDA